MIVWPATPTPQPPGVAHFNMEDVYSLWSAAPVAIQTWNWLGVGAAIIQLLVILALIVVGGYVFYRAFMKLAERDSQS